MGNVTLLEDPNASVDNANWTFTGGSNVWGVLAGATDATYAVANANNGTSHVDYADITIPAGAQIRSVKLVVRALSSGGYMSVGVIRYGMVSPVMLTAGTKPPGSLTTYSWVMTNDPVGQAWTPFTVNNFGMLLGANSGVRVTQSRIEVVYNERPTVSAVTVTGTSSRPTVSYTYSDPGGDSGVPDAQERLVVRVFPDYVANAIKFNPDTNPNFSFDSGEVYSSNPSYVLTKSLAPGSYVFYVKAADSGSHGRYSLWSSSSYAVAGSPPAPPSILSATADNTHGYNVITARQNDNLLGYNQAGFESTTDALAWYKDTNVTTLDAGTSSATNKEGSRVLRMTATAASIAKVRSGGTWATAGLGGSQNIALNQSVPIVNNTGGNLSTSSFTPPNGSLIFAHISSDSAGYADPSPAITISSSPTLTWTLVNEAKYSVTGKRSYCAVYRAQGTGVATTVTIAGGSSGVHRALHCTVMTGVDTVTPVGAHAAGSTLSSSISQNYTSTAAGSWGWMAYADYQASAVSAGTGCAVDAFKYDGNFTGVTLKRQSATSTSGSTVTLAMTATSYPPEANYVYYEIMPASSPSGVPSTLLAGIPVIAGSVYTKQFSAWTADNVAKTCRCDVEWYDVTGALLSTTTGGTMTTSTGTLLVQHSESVTAPTNAVCAVLLLVNTNPGAAEVTHFDQVGLTLGANARWYRGGMQVPNLLSGNAGSLELATGGWAIVTGDTWSNVSRVANANVKPGQVLQTYVTSQPKTTQAQSGQIPGITPGITYVFFAMAMTVAGTPNGYLTIQFEDANANVISSVVGAQVALGASTWQLLQVSAACPVGATYARLIVSAPLTATGSGNAVLWTRLGLAQGATAPTCWQPGPAPNTYPLVESSDDAGTTWTKVRGTDLVDYDPTNSWQAVVNDYEAPSNTSRAYRVSTAGIDYGIDPLGFYIVSVPSDTLSATLAVTDFYLVDSYTATRYLMEQEGEIAITSEEPQAIFQALGRSTDIVTYDEPKSKHFAFTLGMLSGAELDAFESLRASGHILFLQTPFARSWYVKLGPTQTTTWLMSPDATGRFNVAITLIQVTRPVS